MAREESGWIDALGRRDLAARQDALFAGLIAGHVMVEAYVPADLGLVEEIVLPAFDRCLRRFGRAPLIADLLEITGEHPEEILAGYHPEIAALAACAS